MPNDLSIYECQYYWDGQKTGNPGYGKWDIFPSIVSILTEHLEFSNQSRLLDVGCGCGFVVACRETFYGMDISNFAVHHCTADAAGRIVRANGVYIPFANSSFYCVLSISFLEHVLSSDVSRVVSEMFRVSNRWVVSSIGTVDNYHNVMEFEFDGCNIPDHLNEETKFQISRGHWTLKRAGWWRNVLAEFGAHRFDLVDAVLEKTSKLVPATDQSWIRNDPGLFILEKGK